jgi:hypothetical protein
MKEAIDLARHNIIRNLLRREFTDFFVAMTTEKPENNWPAVSQPEMIEGLADSLLEMGKLRGNGIALLQTLAHELQDRANQLATQSRKRNS